MCSHIRSFSVSFPLRENLSENDKTVFDGAKNWLQNKGIQPNISELEQVNNDIKALEKKCSEGRKSVRDLEQKYRNITQYLGIDKEQDTIKKEPVRSSVKQKE